MRRATSSRLRRGFTIIEGMIALAVLAVAAAGALLALVNANQMIREGQLRQLKMVLVEASAQRGMFSLANTDTTADAGPVVTTTPDNAAIGASPWKIDDSPALDLDLGTGAFFKLFPDGTITPMTCDGPDGGGVAGCLSTATYNSCGAALPNGIYCREIAVGPNLPPGANSVVSGELLDAGAGFHTRWIRVSRKGEPRSRAVVYREVVVR